MNETESIEHDFLSGIIDSIDGELKDTDLQNTNPMEMVGSLLNSNLFSNIFENMTTNIDNGNIDLSKLVNTAQSLMANLQTEISKNDTIDPNIKSMVSMLSTSMEPLMAEKDKEPLIEELDD